MKADKVDVIYDDRNIRPGAMFSDADLIAAPVRVVVSPKNLKEDVVEISTRDKTVQMRIPKDNAVKEIKALITELYKAYEV